MAQRIALIIHIDTYPHLNLAGPTPPAAATASLAALLGRPDAGNFNRVETLINPPLSKLRRQMADFFQRKQRQDELLLYVVGHGLVAQAGQIYLATVDTRPDMLAETALPAAYLTECMDRSFSRRQILLLDWTCYELADLSFSSAAGIQLAEAFKGKGYGRMVLTRTQTIQGAGQIGFTGHVLEALQTGQADADGDGQIELKELSEYIRQQAVGFRPYLRIYGYADTFIVARNPHSLVPVQPIKWDLISGAILAPTTIIVIGGWADWRTSLGLAALFLLMYTLLYLAPD